MFDSKSVVERWALPYLWAAVEREGYRGIVGFRSIYVDASSESDMVPYSDSDYARAVIVVSGIAYRESGSTVHVDYMIDADEFSLVRFLDEVQEIASAE